MSSPGTSARPQGRPTIYDVARAAGVSKSLVSLVLHGSERVSEARRAAVLRAIEELGYRPSVAAASLASSRTRSIGVVVDDLENLWYLDLLKGMRDVLNLPGFHLSVADRNLNAHLDLDPVDAFLARGVEGLVLAAEPDHARPTHDVPVVVAGAREQTDPTADVVANDDTAGARLATEHLLELGHTQVGHVTGSGRAAALRLSSYVATMDENGLRPAVAGGGDTPATEESGYRATRRLMAEHPGITAVFAANDTMALGALAALREHGLRVPDDVSLVGYDNSPLAQSRYLSITTVDDRSTDVGTEAARALLSRIEQPDRQPTRILLEPALVPRSSTALRAPAPPRPAPSPPR